MYLFEISCFGDTVRLNLFSFILENPAVKGFKTRSYCQAVELFQKKYGNCCISFKSAHVADDMDLPNISLNYFQDFRGDVLSHEKSCELLYLCRKFHMMGELNKPVQTLIDFGWLREVELGYRGYGRKPSPVLEVNPLLFGKRT